MSKDVSLTCPKVFEFVKSLKFDEFFLETANLNSV